MIGYSQRFSSKEIFFDERNTAGLIYYLDDIYRQTNFGSRSGTCYMLRKERNRPPIHDENAVCVDGFSHQELQEAFNTFKYFICYDVHTLYSMYASLCGCLSVVAPIDGVSRKQWCPSEDNRYGVAYGMDDIEYARTTRPLLLEKVRNSFAENQRNADKFAQLCQDHFGKS